MERANITSTIIATIILIACFSAIVAISRPLESAKPTLPETVADSDLSMNGSRLKGFALGMEGLLADWYWMRSLQYLGDKMIKHRGPSIDYEDLTPLEPRLLFPLLENAVELDPHFIGAYSYGAIVFPAIDKQKAIEFASKGIANNPAEWRLYQHLGYIYWRLGDFDKAAETYEKGAAIPGSSSFMRLMAASMRTEGGSRATARSIYRQMLAESPDEPVRITASRRLKELEWLDEKEAINKVLADFREKNGRCSTSFGEVGEMLLQTDLPEGRQFRVDSSRRLVDPTGAPYVLDKENCVVTLDREKTELPFSE